jgi:hypothetical protein
MTDDVDLNMELEEWKISIILFDLIQLSIVKHLMRHKILYNNNSSFGRVVMKYQNTTPIIC